MNDPIAAEPFELRCRACGHAQIQTFGWIAEHKTYTCICGAQVNARQLVADSEIKKLRERKAVFERMLAELEARKK